MDRRTELALNRINRRFYREHAEAFSSTRGAPWGGWKELLPLLGATGPRPLEVLDAGCGNGRFGVFLARHRQGEIRYLGIDASPELLAIARRRLEGPAAVELRQRDLVERPLEIADLGGRRFDLAVAFGVLHHLPGRRQRRRFLESLAPLLRPGGLLAFSVWRFDRDPRLLGRSLDRAQAAGGEGLDLSQLEPGDHLLRWGEGEAALRYCHAADEAEEQEWLAALPLELVRCFEADGRGGRLNRYLALRSSEDAIGSLLELPNSKRVR